MAGHVVAGVELARLVSLAGGIELWEGRTADGEPRDVCLIELSPGPAAMARALVSARAFVGIEHVALQSLLAAAPHGERLALVRSVVRGWPLDAVLASAGGLDAGEGATVACSVAEGIAALHRRGLTHGGVDTASVRIRPDGSVVLVDLAVATASDRARTPPEDVLDLARMVTGALAARSARAGELTGLLAALDPALSGHPAARPGAGPLATSCSSAAVQRPVRVPPPRRPPPASSPPRPPRVSTPAVRRGVHRAGTAVAVVAGLAVAATVLGPRVVRGRSPAAAAVGQVVRPGLSSKAAAPSPSWADVLTDLARERAGAYAAADSGRLAAVDAAGSSADAIDRANIAAWRLSGERITGGVASVTVVSSARTGLTVAEVTTVEHLSSYVVTDRTGHRTVHPAGAPKRWKVHLVMTAAGWRTALVQPMASGN